MIPFAKLYNTRHSADLVPIAEALQTYVQEIFQEQPRIDRITARAKNAESFLKKSEKLNGDGSSKYNDPLNQIQDQIGVRIVVFFTCDVEVSDMIIKKYFRPIEFRDVVPDSEWEFGYFGRHYILRIPPDVVSDDMDDTHVPAFFELQLKTLFQHAWSEAEHDLGYKPGERPLTGEQKRLLAFSSAQAWGADHIFNQLFQERETSKLSSTAQENLL